MRADRATASQTCQLSNPSRHSFSVTSVPAMSFITVAAATLPSVPLDFQGNRDRILESIRIAKEKGATLRTGPEARVPSAREIVYKAANSLIARDPRIWVIHAYSVLHTECSASPVTDSLSKLPGPPSRYVETGAYFLYPPHTVKHLDLGRPEPVIAKGCCCW